MTTLPEKFVLAFLVLFFMILTGTIWFHYFEGWDFMESLYATVVTLATVGYGDFVPKSRGGMLFAIFIIISGVSTMFQIGVVTRGEYTIRDHEYIVHKQDGRKIKHTFPRLARGREEFETLGQELFCGAEAAKC